MFMRAHSFILISVSLLGIILGCACLIYFNRTHEAFGRGRYGGYCYEIGKMHGNITYLMTFDTRKACQESLKP